jgi:small subunit ribosomal protein S4
MSKRSSAKHKLDRRMGENIWGRPKSPVNRREYGPGQHGQRRKGKLSDFGVQLRAKQKLKGYYANISEKQFFRIYAEASRLRGDTSAHLIGLLERRLDAVVYRAKFVPTPFAARQLVSHGHVKVNGRRVTVPSMRLKVGDVVELTEREKHGACDGSRATRRARRARLHRSGSREGDGEDPARTVARRSALSGADGAQSRRRILFALIVLHERKRMRKGRLMGGLLLYRAPTPLVPA